LRLPSQQSAPASNQSAAARPDRRAAAARVRWEVDLYEPVKWFLEARGYVVKGEVRGCDVVAVRGPDEPVVVELKRTINLGLVLQGVDRFAITDLVYLAVPAAPAATDQTMRAFTPAHPGIRRLCRRLGLGLLAVAAEGGVEIVLDPEPYRLPRRNKARAARLLREHARRQGDPTRGGGTGGKPIVTAYRQEALRCAWLLHRNGGGPLTVETLREGAAAPNAGRLLYRNVYGWFEPAGREIYRLTAEGERGLATFAGDFAMGGEGEEVGTTARHAEPTV
jgi:hypothetical protein